jgi:hypothetical protein
MRRTIKKKIKNKRIIKRKDTIKIKKENIIVKQMTKSRRCNDEGYS